MSKAFVIEERFPLHIIQTNDPRWKKGKGHAVEISCPYLDHVERREARLVLKTAAGSQMYLYKEAIVHMFRSAGPADASPGQIEKYRLNRERGVLILAAVLVCGLLALKTSTLFLLPALIPVSLLAFSPHVRVVLELADGAGNSTTFITCYLPRHCYYRLYQLELLRIT